MNENWKFSDIPYTRPDVEALQARYDALTRRARDAAGPEELLRVVRDRDALQQEVSLCQSIATIRAFHDVTDAFYQTEFQETLPRLETLDSQSLAQAIVESMAAPAKQEAEKEPSVQKGFRCTVCGYVYEGDTLPEDFTCPICHVGADRFAPIS